MPSSPSDVVHAGLSTLIRKLAPYDTYSIHKLGRRVRVDGTLMGMDRKRQGLIPNWKRGHFSLLFDGSGDKVATIGRSLKAFVFSNRVLLSAISTTSTIMLLVLVHSARGIPLSFLFHLLAIV